MSAFFKIVVAIGVFIAAAFSQNAAAQVGGKSMFLTVNTRLVDINKYDGVSEGSPFLYEEWMPAAILLMDGKVAQNVPVKMNLLDNEVWFKNEAGEALVSTEIIKSVVFKNAGNDTTAILVSKAGMQLPAIDDGWYQLLAKGNASLLKRLQKVLKEHREYGSSAPTQVIETETQYFVWHKSSFIRVKTVQEIADVVKSDALNTWIAGKKKGSKSEADLKATVDYFNSLPAK